MQEKYKNVCLTEIFYIFYRMFFYIFGFSQYFSLKEIWGGATNELSL